ncbi:MAG: hypothetical protein J6W84_09720 [Bacteroidales bacterium]|nr:hypothetical protein [Bacteroidales bacterium]MBQ7490448.1 hypothetical protein [Bacteroidales bacterium]
MKIDEIIALVEGKLIEGKTTDEEVTKAFASDLMSDVLTIKDASSLLLITGLANMQTIRTCEMSEIRYILFVRGKKVTEEMKELAEENNMVLIETSYSMYKVAGILYANNINPLY